MSDFNDFCPKCQEREWVGVEYMYNHRHHYDGVSEWRCRHCGFRKCRWCDEELKEHEVAPVFCRGEGHPLIVSIDGDVQEPTKNT